MSEFSLFEDQIVAHVEKYVGPVQPLWRDDRSEFPLEIRVVPSNEERRFHFVFTLGMSDRPMNAPDAQWRRAELCILLPPEWSLEREMGEDETNFWPLRLLGELANLPFQRDTWLGLGHTITNGEPSQPYSSETALCGAMLLPPLELAHAFARLRLADDEILNFWNVVPLHADELNFKIGKGLPSLLQAFEKKGVSDILNPTRASALGERGSLKRWLG